MDDEDFQERVTYMIRRVSAALGQQVDRALREFGLTGAQIGVLSHLKLVRPAGLSGAELAARTGVTPQSMSTAIAGLLERGLVERQPHPVHGRILEVRITPAGVTLRDQAQRAMAELNDRIVAPLDVEQRTQLNAGLRGLMASLELYAP